MKRAKRSPEWKEFERKCEEEGFEIITRVGDPVLLHRKGTPISLGTVWLVFFGKKSGKWSKSQARGMEFFEKLGLHIFKYRK